MHTFTLYLFVVTFTCFVVMHLNFLSCEQGDFNVIPEKYKTSHVAAGKIPHLSPSLKCYFPMKAIDICIYTESDCFSRILYLLP